MTGYSIEELIGLHELIGYKKNQEGVYCLECWNLYHMHEEADTKVLTASDLAESNDIVFCENCGKVLWE